MVNLSSGCDDKESYPILKKGMVSLSPKFAVRFFRELLRAFFRTKTCTHDYSKLSKVMDMFDVTIIGLGTTVGMSSYIFIGFYAQHIGPAMVISFLLAAIISFMNALCYAEFISREPGSGGVYSQAYYLLGEFAAAIIGWLLAMENIIGSALTARGMSEVIDILTNNRISKYMKSLYTFSSPWLTDYPDIVAFMSQIIVLTIVSFGLKEVTRLHNFLVGINITLLVLIVMVSGSNINFAYWALPPSEKCGNGGFMPYGISSVWVGIKQVSYAYIGFGAAAHAGSEVTDPERTIPIALLLSVMIATTLYLLQSFTYTLIWPYCDQDTTTPIQYVMDKIGMGIMKWITTIGSPLALIGKMICSTYPMSRLIYAIAEDGLIYSCMANVDIHTKTPIIALYTTGIVTAILALFINKFRLAEVCCMGAMCVYCLVSMCVLTLRYTEDDMMYGDPHKPIIKIIFNMDPAAESPTVISSLVVLMCSAVLLVSALPVQAIFYFAFEYVKKGEKLEVFMIVVIIIFYCFLYLIIVNQPVSTQRLGIQVFLPNLFRPTLPFFCILINTHICVGFSGYSWSIWGLWMLFGTFVYFTYGIWHSKARQIEIYVGTRNKK